jgi:hypothetical protein
MDLGRKQNWGAINRVFLASPQKKNKGGKVRGGAAYYTPLNYRRLGRLVVNPRSFLSRAGES